jgi:hypothetical protein
MAWTFNPFSGTFDQKGSGGGGGSSYLEGEVQNFSALPTATPPAIDAAYLVREAEGAWLLNRKPAGIYIRVATTGTRATDWTYAGEFPDVFSDDKFVLYDETDSSKNLVFQLSGITTGTTRTLTAPNASGRIQVEGQPIGNTTPAAGTFTTLTANNGTLTASAPVLDLAQTWNASGTTFTGLRFTVAETAAAIGSRYFSIDSGGTSIFSLQTRGANNGSELISISGPSRGLVFGPHGTASSTSFFSLRWQQNLAGLASNAIFAWGSDVYNLNFDLAIQRDAAHTLAQRIGTNPQTYNIYNTFTSATNHERGFLKWSSNVFQIGTEKGSAGGTARNLEFILDGTSVATMEPSGYFGNANVGIHFRQTGSGNRFSITSQGQVRLLHNNGILLNEASGGYGWVASGSPTSLGFDTGLFRDASGVVAIRNGTNAQAVRLYSTVSGTNNVNFDRVNFRWASNEFIIDAEAGGTGTLRGIKIGSATSSLLGFYGVTPVDQPATVADPAGGGTIDTEARTAINAIIDRLQELGLVA